jgi:uncharacterized phage protein (TIGR02220 family)
MGKDPAFLFYPGDYLRDTQCLSPAAQVAYDRIMCEHMRNICISHAQLKFFTKRLTDDEREEVMAVLKEADGCFQIEWVAESICKRKDYSESRRKNRTSKPKNDVSHISSTYDNHMENENENEIVNEDEVVTETGIARIEKNQTGLVLADQYDQYIAVVNEITGKNFRGDKKSRTQFNARIKDGYTLDDFRRAVTNATKLKIHQDNGFHYLTPELFTRQDKLEMHSNSAPSSGTQMLNRKQTINEARDIYMETAALIEASKNQNP